MPPDHCNSQGLCRSALNPLNNELYWCCFSNAGVLSPWTEKVLEILRGATPPPPICLPLLFIMSLWLWLNFPSIFAYCKWSKTGAGNGLGRTLNRKQNKQLTRLIFPAGTKNIIWEQDCYSLIAQALVVTYSTVKLQSWIGPWEQDWDLLSVASQLASA